jgi:peptidoglycan hydrolase CwlO-like protein
MPKKVIFVLVIILFLFLCYPLSGQSVSARTIKRYPPSTSIRIPQYPMRVSRTPILVAFVPYPPQGCPCSYQRSQQIIYREQQQYAGNSPNYIRDVPSERKDTEIYGKSLNNASEIQEIRNDISLLNEKINQISSRQSYLDDKFQKLDEIRQEMISLKQTVLELNSLLNKKGRLP